MLERQLGHRDFIEEFLYSLHNGGDDGFHDRGRHFLEYLPPVVVRYLMDWVRWKDHDHDQWKYSLKVKIRTKIIAPSQMFFFAHSFVLAKSSTKKRVEIPSSIFLSLVVIPQNT